jgi:hypothetical protein
MFDWTSRGAASRAVTEGMRENPFIAFRHFGSSNAI